MLRENSGWPLGRAGPRAGLPRRSPGEGGPRRRL